VTDVQPVVLDLERPDELAAVDGVTQDVRRVDGHVSLDPPHQAEIMVEALEAKLTADVRTAVLPRTTDVHALATFYSAVIQGMSAQARDGASQADLEGIATAALKAWPVTPRRKK
jgi:hypothetical protein